MKVTGECCFSDANPMFGRFAGCVSKEQPISSAKTPQIGLLEHQCSQELGRQTEPVQAITASS